MLYAIWGVDAPDSLAGRQATRPAHVERLKALLAEGRLVLAGPRPKADAADAPQAGFHGSLIVAEFPSLEAACNAVIATIQMGIPVARIELPFRLGWTAHGHWMDFR